MKKGVEFLLLTMYVLLMTGCGRIASAEDMQMVENEVLQENTISVNFDDVATQSDLDEQYCVYLGQVTEKSFMSEEGVESADATVTYDEETGQYSIELSIITNGEVGGEQIEIYKSILRKTYAEVVLLVDGEVM